MFVCFFVLFSLSLVFASPISSGPAVQFLQASSPISTSVFYWPEISSEAYELAAYLSALLVAPSAPSAPSQLHLRQLITLPGLVSLICIGR